MVFWNYCSFLVPFWTSFFMAFFFFKYHFKRVIKMIKVPAIPIPINAPFESSHTSDHAPQRPGINVWMYSVRAARPNACTKVNGVDQNHFFFFFYIMYVSAEKIPNTRNERKCPTAFLIYLKNSCKSLMTGCFLTSSFTVIVTLSNE